jgi:hypothetical protein
MSDPNKALYWLIGLICCPGPICFTLGILLANAIHRGVFFVDRSKLPRWGKRRNE